MFFLQTANYVYVYCSLWISVTNIFFILMSFVILFILLTFSFTFNSIRHEKSLKVSTNQNLNLTNFHKYTRFTKIVETIKFDWNNQTNQYNSHLELFLDMQKVYKPNQLWLCIFISQIYLNIWKKYEFPNERKQ